MVLYKIVATWKVFMTFSELRLIQEDKCMIKVINEAEFSEVLEKDVAFVDFFTTWCGPCKMLGPVLENISDNVDGASFFKIDVDDAEEIAAKYGIMSIPTVFAFKKGEVVAKNVGYNGPEALEKFVKDNL